MRSTALAPLPTCPASARISPCRSRNDSGAAWAAAQPRLHGEQGLAEGLCPRREHLVEPSPEHALDQPVDVESEAVATGEKLRPLRMMVTRPASSNTSPSRWVT